MAANEINGEGPNVPTEGRALKRFEQRIELGELEEIVSPWLPVRTRYLVTYMNSQTAARQRSLWLSRDAVERSGPQQVRWLGREQSPAQPRACRLSLACSGAMLRSHRPRDPTSGPGPYG